MQINIKFTDTPVDDRLRAYANEKVNAFTKILHGRELEATVCDIEFQRSTHHQTGDVCRAEVTLDTGSKVYRSSKEEPTLEKAIDKVKDDILAELRNDKGRARDLVRRGAATMKRMLRGGGF
jgi:ribosomal subunit interface protein